MSALSLEASTALVVGGPVCPDGCCLVHYDPHIGRPPREAIDGQWVRPMFEVFHDAGLVPQHIDFHPEDGMRVPVTEYDRADRIFL